MNILCINKNNYAKINAFKRKWQTDEGLITNQTALPIRRFDYGYLQEGSQAKVSLGRLQCQGKSYPTIKGLETCADLR